MVKSSILNRMLSSLGKTRGGHTDSSQQTIRADFSSIQKSSLSFFKSLKLKILEFLKDHKIDIRYLVLAIPIIAIFLLVWQVQRQQSLRSGAAAGQARIFIQPATFNLPPEGNFQLWLDAGSPTGFVATEIDFDPSLIKLTTDPQLTSTFSRVIKNTTMLQANSTGKIVLVMALDPSQLASAPTGTVQLANFRFNANTSAVNTTTSININSGQSQVVATDKSVFILTVTGTNLVLNATVSTPTPTPSPVPSGSSLPSPTPAQNDNIPPVVQITNPSNNSVLATKGSVKAQVAATDVSGIANIVISLDNQVIRTCTGVTSCQGNISLSRVSSGVHTITAVATDKSVNKNTGSASITVTKP